MNNIRFLNEKDNDVIVSIYERGLRIDIKSVDKSYYFNYNDVESFQVQKSHYFTTLGFIGKLNYIHKDKTKQISSVFILIKNIKDFDYKEFFEENTPLKTPLSIYNERLKVFNEKVYNNKSSERGTVYLYNCPRFGIWTIYVDGFEYAKTNLNETVFSFELPYGEYKIHYSASNVNPDSHFDGGQSSNDVEIKLDDYNREVKLKAKRGFINLKLEKV